MWAATAASKAVKLKAPRVKVNTPHVWRGTDLHRRAETTFRLKENREPQSTVQPLECPVSRTDRRRVT